MGKGAVFIKNRTVPFSRPTEYTYDLMSRITEITDALGGSTRFTYDENGNITSVTDAKNQTIRYTYDVRDRVASMIDQLGKTETYAYEVNYNLTSITDRKGQTTTFSYDTLSRMIKAEYGDGSYTDYSYDAGDRLMYVNDSVSGPMQYVYNNNGCSACGSGAVDKVIQEITPLGAISYEYNALGWRTKATVAGQEPIYYNYDAVGRLISLSQGNKVVTFAYDALGRRISMTLPNGVTTTYSYDNASNLLELVHHTPQQIIEKLAYSYDKNGNRLSMDRQNIAPKLPNPASNITYNSANQMLTFNDKNITYDANGNMETITNSCGTTAYTWNARNQLAAIDGFDDKCQPLTASFKYDALGRRIEKSINGGTIQYLYDGLDIIQEIKDGTVYANYLRTLNIDEPLVRIKADGTVRYYQQDALGSVIALTDESGVIRTQYTYDPFGNTSLIGEPSDNPFQFASREDDGTGLLYERFRYYSPELQRYLSEDPIGFVGGDVNFYVRVWNRPTMFIDPMGLIGLITPGFTNVRWPDSNMYEPDPNDAPINPDVEWMMSPTNHNAIPGQFGTLGLFVTYKAGSAFWQDVISPVGRTLMYNTPLIITIDPKLYPSLGPAPAEACPPTKSKKRKKN